MLDRRSGKVLNEYNANEITIIESCWVSEADFNRKRPSRVEILTPDLHITVKPETVIYFNRSSIDYTGFIDFMSHQPDNAKIEYNNKVYEGNAFYEYLVSDMGTIIG